MVEITWLGHSSLQLRLEGGQVVLIDPWLAGNPKHPAGFELSRVDAILITHGHFDHIASVVEVARRFQPKVLAIHEIAVWLESKGVENCIGMNKGGSCAVEGLKATMTHAVHSSSIQDGDTTLPGGEAAGYVVEFGDGRRAYFAGDTAVFGDMKLIAELYAPELCVLPIGDHYTMGPREAALACRLLNARTVIPIHWGTFPALAGRPEDLAAAAPGTKIWTLEPGKPVNW